MRAQELLSTVRAQVLLDRSTSATRCSIRIPRLRPSIAGGWKRRTAPSTRRCEQYVPVLDSSVERERIEGLRREIDELSQRHARGARTPTAGARPPRRALLLDTQIVPKREVVIRVSEEVQALNRSAFVQQQADIAAIYGATQRRSGEGLGLALAASSPSACSRRSMPAASSTACAAAGYRTARTPASSSSCPPS